MFYYDHNIGDFAIETRGLTYELIGIYISLLDWYASTQKPITSDWLDVAYQGENKSKAIALLKAFFVKRDEGYVHLAIEKQIIAFEEMSRKRSEAGKKGGRRKKALPSAATECEETALASNSLANAFLTNNHKPLTNNQVVSSTPNVNDEVIDGGVAEQDPDVKEGLFNDEPPFPTQRKAVAVCPYEKIKALYAEILPELPQPVMLSAARKTAMKARWQDVFNEEGIKTEAEGIECFRNFFALVRQSKFLMGRTSKWKATLDWLMKQENFLKVCEQKYKD